MALTFNTSGPCVPGEHYMISPERRFTRVMELVDQKKYFTVVSGRQTGKTTALQWLVKHYNAGQRYAAVWVDIQTAREEPEAYKGLAKVLDEFEMALERDQPSIERPARAGLMQEPSTSVLKYLQTITRKASRPLVVLVDEADGLIGETMVSFLTQLRRGYIERSQTPFPHALALAGMRQVRDYVMSSDERRLNISSI